MLKMKSTKAAMTAANLGENRTLQALDQAAGGSGDIAPRQAEQASPAKGRPEHGTDDARCEDSVESALRREQTADEVSFRISHLETASRSDKAVKSATAAARIAGASAPRQERVDAEIRADIESRLKADQVLDSASIFVAVSHGRVIIEGSVENHEAKQRAEAISRQGDGIVGHDSNLVVRRLS